MHSMLVDTHTILWFVFDDPRLSPRAGQILSEPDPVKVLSIASLWEIAIKLNIDKLKIGMSYVKFLNEYVENRDIEILDIRTAHFKRYVKLPLHHRDPFDRLLIAQAQEEDLPLLTSDSRFSDYDIETVW